MAGTIVILLLVLWGMFLPSQNTASAMATGRHSKNFFIRLLSNLGLQNLFGFLSEGANGHNGGKPANTGVGQTGNNAAAYPGNPGAITGLDTATDGIKSFQQGGVGKGFRAIILKRP